MWTTRHRRKEWESERRAHWAIVLPASRSWEPESGVTEWQSWERVLAFQTGSNQNSERKDLFSPHATLARKKRENRIPKNFRRKSEEENVTDLLNNSVIQLLKNQHAKTRCFCQLFQKTQKTEFCLNSAKISKYQDFKNCLISRLVTLSLDSGTSS